MSYHRDGPRAGRLRASDAANSQRSSAPATVPPIPSSDDQLDLVSPASRPSSSLSQSRSSATPTRQRYIANTPAPPSRTSSRVGGRRSASEDSPSRQATPTGSTDLEMRDVTPSVSGQPRPVLLSLTLEPETVEEDFEAATLALETVTSLLRTCNEYPDDYPLRDPLLIREALRDFAAALDLPAWQRVRRQSRASVSEDEDDTIRIPTAT
ncbi:hypothetical protein FA15DRAFT_711460 [Coprinopsis marcescibilis]|uniref:Uncharacterized protein n=1 Tax=Coprinopsis marcescibilis TaxID=230819 RepID=A0A5C3KAJ2_COPMA|nr:hypothetical protein FA15DRAFT_711460 [Coprinopsis marcescibilis]